MSTQFELYEEDLKKLSKLKMELQYKLEAKKEEAAAIKKELQALGFNSLDEAKEAYNNQTKELEVQAEKLRKLLREIQEQKKEEPSSLHDLSNLL